MNTYVVGTYITYLDRQHRADSLGRTNACEERPRLPRGFVPGK